MIKWAWFFRLSIVIGLVDGFFRFIYGFLTVENVSLGTALLGLLANIAGAMTYDIVLVAGVGYWAYKVLANRNTFLHRPHD